MVEMPNDLEKHPTMRRLIYAFQQEGFESSLEYEHNDKYVTLTIQRKRR
jgi:hypothetical protein